METFALPGSERQPLPGSQNVGAADPTERLEVSVILRRREPSLFDEHMDAAASGAVQPVTQAVFADHFGASEDDIVAVRAFAQANGLTVVDEHAARRTVMLSGTVARFSRAFGVQLDRYQHRNGTYRGRVGSIHLPANLRGVVQAVLGLDNRPQAAPHFRVRPPENVTRIAFDAAPLSYTPLQIASLYAFPPGDGAGQCIGLIELGGGYRPDDLQTYFAGLGVSTPTVTAVSVDHATNSPTGNSSGPDGEVVLDIEVAGAIAPAAKIAVYFAPNTDAGFLDAITTAIHDTTNKPSVISISWGSAESSWSQQTMTAFDDAFQSAAALGITVCVASGDNGSSDGVADGSTHVDFPASSPFALSCGGTDVQATGATIVSETVWNDGANGGATGGGTSSFFPLPTWQAGLTTSNGTTTTPLANRGVPDVSGDADPQSGYDVRVDGSNLVIGGTSAVAPLWAGLLARINGNSSQPVGYANPRLYAAPSALHDIVQGNNGAFFATAGWDACTGLGRPVGDRVATALTPVTAAQSSAEGEWAGGQTVPAR